MRKSKHIDSFVDIMNRANLDIYEINRMYANCRLNNDGYLVPMSVSNQKIGADETLYLFSDVFITRTVPLSMFYIDGKWVDKIKY